MLAIRTAARTATRRTRLAIPALVTSLLLALASCTTSATTTDSATTAAPDGAAMAVTVTDPWVKAVDGGMTGVFGTLTNESDAEIRIVSAESPVSPVAELHEVTADEAGEMVMQPKEGGFVLAAGGTHELVPGGDHIMLMDVGDPLEPGEEITVTLTAQDGSSVTFTAPARSYTGANETYQGGDTEGGMGEGHTGTPEPTDS
ncbi:copper chaperone PCu(A)C [Cellulomonas sp. KRMCY2]|uniref:copper chaperone PCu(A)C n=1 Tax=Cellulomonas sp. KRMCY2 TaxID=1304865 RepID=UPI00045E7348|nr:copper chaperone PCu(A)C [Cellulomonas sp. KRMCY2]